VLVRYSYAIGPLGNCKIYGTNPNKQKYMLVSGTFRIIQIEDMKFKRVVLCNHGSKKLSPT
jgi:hypothetical protein